MAPAPPDRPPTVPPNPTSTTMTDDAYAQVRKMFSAEQYEKTKSLVTMFCSSSASSSLRAVAVAQSLTHPHSRAMSVPADAQNTSSSHRAPSKSNKRDRSQMENTASASPVIPSPASTNSGGFDRSRVRLDDAAELFAQKERDRRREKKRRHNHSHPLQQQEDAYDARYASVAPSSGAPAGPEIKVEPPSYAHAHGQAEWYGGQPAHPNATTTAANASLASHQHHVHHQHGQHAQHSHYMHQHPPQHPPHPLLQQQQYDSYNNNNNANPAQTHNNLPTPHSAFRRSISDTAAYVHPRLPPPPLPPAAAPHTHAQAMSTMDRFMEEKERRDALARAATVHVKQEVDEEGHFTAAAAAGGGEEDEEDEEEGESPTPSPVVAYAHELAYPSSHSLYPPPYASHSHSLTTPQKPHSHHPTDPKSIPPTSSPFHPDLPPSAPFPVPPGPRPSSKPAWSYAALIGQAIGAAPSRRASLSQIYNWISTAYPFYRRSEAGWQNSIRHNLSLNECFVKIKRDEGEKGKGCWWGIRPGDEVCFAGGGFRKKGSSVRNPPGSSSSGSAAGGTGVGGGRKRKVRERVREECESEEEGSVRGAAAKRQAVAAAGVVLGGARRRAENKQEPPIVWAVPDDNHHFAVPPAYPPPMTPASQPAVPTPAASSAPPASAPAPTMTTKPTSTPPRAPSPLPPLAQQFPNMPGLTPSGPSSPPGPSSSPLALTHSLRTVQPSALQPNFELPQKSGTGPGGSMPPPATPKSKVAEILGNRGSDRRLPAIPGMGGENAHNHNNNHHLRTPPPKRGMLYESTENGTPSRLGLSGSSGSGGSGSKSGIALPSPFSSALNSTPSRALHHSTLFASPSTTTPAAHSSHLPGHAPSSLGALFGTPLGRALANRWDMSDPATQANEDLQMFISSGTKLGLFESPVRGRGRGVWDSPGFEGW